MTTLLVFEPGLSLQVDEDAEAVRQQMADASDGLVELHSAERKVLVKVDAIKFAKEEAERGPRKPMGFDTKPAVVKN